MWVLENNPELEGVVHYLPCNKLLQVKRATQSSGHILLSNDKSISREHATIFILHDDANISDPSKIPEVVLTDLSSKYGTFLNEGIQKKEKVLPQVPSNLNSGDFIRFGIFSNVWQINYHPLIVTSSQINDSRALSECIKCLGGHFVSSWAANCNLLIMNEISLTIKTVCALASCCHIVTPEYILALKTAVENKQKHPSPLKYLPLVKEISINTNEVCFFPNERRKSLFQGKTFIICSEKALRKMKFAISLAGGTAMLLSNDTYPRICHNGTVVVKPSEEKLTQPLVVQVLDELRNMNLQAIPESDIGLAILHINIQDYCNSSFDPRKLLKFGGVHSQATQPLKIYATETQDENLQTLSYPPSRVVIPDSGQSKKSSVASSLVPPLPTLEASEVPAMSETCISDDDTQTIKFSTQSVIEELASSKRETNPSMCDPHIFPSVKVEPVSNSLEEIFSSSVVEGLRDKDLENEEDVFKKPLSSKRKNYSPTSPKSKKPRIDNMNDADFSNPGLLIENCPKTLQKTGCDADFPPSLSLMSSRQKRRLLKKSEETQNETINISIKRSLSDLGSELSNITKKLSIQEVEENSNVFIPADEIKKEPICPKMIESNFEKSLVIVEIKDLIRKSRPTLPKIGNSNSGVNFKKFKKVTTSSCSGESSLIDRSSIPRIIGGTDLFIHSDSNLRKDEFLSSQRSVGHMLESDESRSVVNDVIDREFGIPVATKSRVGKRR